MFNLSQFNKALFSGMMFSTILWLIILNLIFALTGCASTGFEKRIPTPNFKGVNYFQLDKRPDMILKQCDLPVLVALSSNFPIAYAEDVKQAVEYWNDAVGEKMFVFLENHITHDFYLEKTPAVFAPDSPESFAVLLVDVLDDKYKKIVSEKTHGLYVVATYTAPKDPKEKIACTGIQRLFVKKDVIYNAHFFHTILRHELGHALGLGHTNDTRLLMHYKSSDQLDRARYAQPCEIRAVRNLYKLEQKHINCGCEVAP